MAANRKFVALVLAIGIGACWPLAMRLLGEVAGPLAHYLGSLLHGLGVSDKATFLLFHRLVFGALWVSVLAVVFGLLLALSVRGSIFLSWLFFVDTALLSSYIVHVVDGYDPWALSAEWAIPRPGSRRSA
jgi:hypothetical protein